LIAQDPLYARSEARDIRIEDRDADACRDDRARIVGLIRDHRRDYQRQTRRQRFKNRPGSAMGDDDRGVREHLSLWHEGSHDHIGRDCSQLCSAMFGPVVSGTGTGNSATASKAVRYIARSRSVVPNCVPNVT